jgi:NAD(P)-dependent dehydrogenase (short-subunit alcohol dehydrogenase family)
MDQIAIPLNGSTVVILGGTSGVGLATAQLAAAGGARVVVASSRQVSVDKALTSLPDTATGRTVDLTDENAVHGLFGDLGSIDHLVYTAGEPLALMPLAELDLDRARAFFQLRYFGALCAVHAAAPHLNEGGSITLTTGTAADRPGPGWAVASSITGAVESLTRALAVELAPRIRVNAVSPGVLRSPMWDNLPDADREGLYADNARAVPLGRVGEVEDAARAYIYCITQPFATGTVMTVDGGAVLA